MASSVIKQNIHSFLINTIFFDDGHATINLGTIDHYPYIVCTLIGTSVKNRVIARIDPSDYANGNITLWLNDATGGAFSTDVMGMWM